MADGRDDAAIVSAVIGLARALRLRTVAEGVETEAQRDRLAALGVDIGQGYHWGRAVPFEDALELVRRSEPTGAPCEAPADRAS